MGFLEQRRAFNSIPNGIVVNVGQLIHVESPNVHCSMYRPTSVWNSALYYFSHGQNDRVQDLLFPIGPIDEMEQDAPDYQGSSA